MKNLCQEQREAHRARSYLRLLASPIVSDAGQENSLGYLDIFDEPRASFTEVSLHGAENIETDQPERQIGTLAPHDSPLPRH